MPKLLQISEVDPSVPRPPRSIDITGWQAKMFKVVSYAGRNLTKSPKGKTKEVWLAKCSCGLDVYVAKHKLLEGTLTSCGCAKRKKGRREDYHLWSK